MKKLMLIAALLPGMAFAEITGSAHDFNTNTRAQANDGQICRYCHIPHGARSQSFIWSHVASSQVYTWGANAKTQSGWTLQTNIASNGSWSAGCLDCHDGSVAVGALYNGVTETFNGAAIDASGRIQGLAKITQGATTNNLTGNHPVSVPYPMTGAGTTFRGQAVPTYTAGYIAEYAAPNAQGVVGALSLARDYAPGGALGVECSTCHDPHNGENLSYLLRVTHTGSAICLNCHLK